MGERAEQGLLILENVSSATIREFGKVPALRR